MLSTYFMSATMDKTQRTIMMIVPLIFITVIARFPAGLVLYWVTTNLWTVGQGLITRRLMPKTPGAELAEPRLAQAARRRPSGNGARKAHLRPSRRKLKPAAAPPRQAEEGRRPAVTGAELTVEATGETVGEAKWKALRELERLAPSLDKAAVRFQVVSEGQRGLLGVGYTPARVLATVSGDAAAQEADPPPEDESPDARRLRVLLEHVTAAIGIRCRIDVVETADEVSVTCTGGDLGLLIGKHGQTIDAVQTLASAMLNGGSEVRRTVTVDASDYRERRRRTIEALAQRSAEHALREGTHVSLEAMGAAERKLVHEHLKTFAGVETASEGDEPYRYVVVKPA